MGRRQSAPLEVLLFHTVALPLKEGLRGVRHILRAIRDRVACVLSSLPDKLRPFGSAAVKQFDRIADRVDRRSSYLAHRYFDPQIAPDAKTAAFSKLIKRDDAAVFFAKVAYDNLKLVTAYICNSLEREENYFISEMLAALAFRRAEARFAGATSDREKAGLLLASMYQTGILRTSASANATKSTDASIEKLARIAGFSTMLWLNVEKDCAPEGEEALLFACCDLAIAIADDVMSAGDDAEKLTDLLSLNSGLV